MISIKTNVAEAARTFEALNIEVKNIGRKMLRALATVLKKRIKHRMGTFLHLRSSGGALTGARGKKLKTGDTGEGLVGSVYGVTRSSTHAVVASGQRWKAEILERGGTISAKKGKYLTFRGDDGSWHRMKSVRIPAKHWFTRSSAGFEDDPDYKGTIDKVIGKAIQKAMK